MSASRWVALHCGDETKALLKDHPTAYLLLTLIAIRAKWKNCPVTGLRIGQAFIGDWREAGIQSEAAYRHAKETLKRCRLATFRGTNKGTIATLANSMVFSISTHSNSGQGSGQGSDQTTGQQQADSKQGTTNHTDTPIDGHTETIHTADSNSAPVGTASNATPPPITSSEAVEMALDLYEKSRRDSESPIGFIKSAEIVSLAKDWHLKYEATGGFLNGSPIRNPKAALEAFLRSAANKQSKRCKELWEFDEDGDEPPF
jgi:hypothetical protein